jgi:hypothetical protein
MKRRAPSTDVRKTMRPGEPGTRRHLRDWGDRLVCVRHRVDLAKGIRFTTVEIVASAERSVRAKREPHPEALVYARVAKDEWELERRLRITKSATYDEFLNVWRMRYETAVRLRLKRRILLHRPARRSGFGPSTHTLSNSNIPTHHNSKIPSHLRLKSREFE